MTDIVQDDRRRKPGQTCQLTRREVVQPIRIALIVLSLIVVLAIALGVGLGVGLRRQQTQRAKPVLLPTPSINVILAEGTYSSTTLTTDVNFDFHPNATGSLLQPGYNTLGGGTPYMQLITNVTLDCTLCASAPDQSGAGIGSYNYTIGSICGACDKTLDFGPSYSTYRSDIEAIKQRHIQVAAANLTELGGSEALPLHTTGAGSDRGHCIQNTWAWKARYNATTSRYAFVFRQQCQTASSAPYSSGSPNFFFNVIGLSQPFNVPNRYPVAGLTTTVFFASE